MQEIGRLKSVDLRELWSDDARNFTRWLDDHIDCLTAELGLRLEKGRTKVEELGHGSVCIRAQQAGTDAAVVIEAQLGPSDDPHCLRFLGYAANKEGRILVWVAGAFSSYHRTILEWMNQSDAIPIDVYAVTVRAYRTGDPVAVCFRTEVKPPKRQRATAKTNTLYAQFHRPLVASLRTHGMRPSKWRGRWRSFHTGHDGTVFATGFEDGKPIVFLSLHGIDHQERLRALRRHHDEIAEKVGGNLIWDDRPRESLLIVRCDEDFDLTGSEEHLETVRLWMADHLVPLRDAVQPHLDRLLGTHRR